MESWLQTYLLLFVASLGLSALLTRILIRFAPRLGLVEGLTKVFYPEASAIVVFVIMAIVLVLRPAGLFGKEA